MKQLIIGIVLGVLAALAGDVIADREASPSKAPTTPPAAAMQTSAALSGAQTTQVAEVLERVKREYVDPIEQPELIDSALRGLVGELDPYSSYLSADEYADLRVSTAGTYAGIGIEVSTADDARRVVRPFQGSPAAVAGIRSGDLIAAIDGRPVGGDLDSAMARMRGPTGSAVKLAVLRAGQTLPLEFTVERVQVDVHSVALASLGSGLVYARISAFSDTTAADFASGLAHLRRDTGVALRGLVLDLRNNPGGVLESAVEVADQLLDAGLIVTADGRTPAARFSMQATPGDLLRGLPMVVLVNASTASAAEILAGALQDHHRATLLGQRTFGKGSVQTVMPLSHGRAIKLTTSRYFTPSGRSIQGRGIEPDVSYENVDTPPPDLEQPRVRATLAARDPAIRAALDVLQGRQPARAGNGMTASATANPWK